MVRKSAAHGTNIKREKELSKKGSVPSRDCSLFRPRGQSKSELIKINFIPVVLSKKKKKVFVLEVILDNVF